MSPVTWHFSGVPTTPGNVTTTPSNVGYWGQTGKHLLTSRLTGFDPFRSSAQPKSRTATGAQRAPDWHLAVRPSARDARHQPRRSCRIPRGYTLRQRFFDLIHRAG